MRSSAFFSRRFRYQADAVIKPSIVTLLGVAFVIVAMPVCAEENPAPSSKAKGKSKDKPSESGTEKSKSAADGKVSLLVRLYFSSHEKLSEQRWVARIPSEEPFKSASPKVIQQSDPEFENADQQFESLD